MSERKRVDSDRAPALAPGVPDDYYRSISNVDDAHWWYAGMLPLEVALLGERLRRRGQAYLDAGCGPGGRLRWALNSGVFDRVCGVDLSTVAVGMAQRVAPEADLRVAPLTNVPFESGTFDLVTLNDVLQHLHEDEMQASLGELRRVLTNGGALMIRTNGARETRRERDDWRVYDSATLRRTLEDAGYRIERLTYANVVASAWAVLTRSRLPKAPTESRDGVPRPVSPLKAAVGSRLLKLEARYLATSGRTLPFGHTLLALATPADS